MSNVTRIKICGITNMEDAQAAVNHGADALGFILVPDTPRYVQSATYNAILANLPPFLQAVAVVKRCEEEASHAQLYDFDAVQFYQGDCTTTVTGRIRCIRAFSIRDENDFVEIHSILERRRPDAILLDTYHKDKLGGSGETFELGIGGGGETAVRTAADFGGRADAGKRGRSGAGGTALRGGCSERRGSRTGAQGSRESESVH